MKALVFPFSDQGGLKWNGGARPWIAPGLPRLGVTAAAHMREWKLFRGGTGEQCDQANGPDTNHFRRMVAARPHRDSLCAVAFP